MTIRASLAGLLVSVLASAWAAAQLAPIPAPPAAPTTAPSTQPSDLNALIRQLGADDVKDRQRAAQQIRAMGKSALPALREAMKNPDPEIQARASELVKDLDPALRKPDQTAVNNRNMGIQPFANGQVRIQIQGGGAVGANGVFEQQVVVINNNHRHFELNENGRKIVIDEGNDGLTMSVTDMVNGKEVTKEYKAKNADELKKNDPEAFKLYEKHAGNLNGGQLRIDHLKIEVAPKIEIQPEN